MCVCALWRRCKVGGNVRTQLNKIARMTQMYFEKVRGGRLVLPGWMTSGQLYRGNTLLSCQPPVGETTPVENQTSSSRMSLGVSRLCLSVSITDSCCVGWLLAGGERTRIVQSTLTTLIPDAPTAAGVWKEVTLEETEELLRKEIIIFAELLRSLKVPTQQMSTTYIQTIRLNGWCEAGRGCEADGLYGATARIQRFMIGHFLEPLHWSCPTAVSPAKFRGGVKSPDLTSCWGSSQAFHCLWECAQAQGTLHIWQLLLATSPPHPLTPWGRLLHVLVDVRPKMHLRINFLLWFCFTSHFSGLIIVWRRFGFHVFDR